MVTIQDIAIHTHIYSGNVFIITCMMYLPHHHHHHQHQDEPQQQQQQEGIFEPHEVGLIALPITGISFGISL